MIPPLDIAFKYTEESIARCRQLADFLKKRQEIEDEYAKALRKKKESSGRMDSLRGCRQAVQIRVAEAAKEARLVCSSGADQDGGERGRLADDAVANVQRTMH